MSNEQEQQFLYKLQMLESYVAEMTRLESTLVGVMREASAAISSIRQVGAQEKSDALVPLGLGAFLKAQVCSGDKVILNIGAGVAVEKNKNDAVNYLESRIKEIEINLQDTSAKRHDATVRLEQSKQQLQQMMASQPAK